MVRQAHYDRKAFFKTFARASFGIFLMKKTIKDIPNKFVDLNKFLNNVCIIWVNAFLVN